MVSRKHAAVSFLHMAAAGQIREAFAAYVAPDFTHHNPWFAGTAEGLIAGMEENARQNPQKTLSVHHAVEDDDLVAVHSHVRQRPDDRGAALVHIFRFEGDLVVELWDIGQPVPAESVNTNGMI